MSKSFTNDFKDIKKDAYKLCKEFLGDVWCELSISEFIFSVISGGLSNTLYRCGLPDTAQTRNPKTPRQVLLRIYGSQKEDLNIVITEVIIFEFLAERTLGPKLYGVFPNGRLEEFIPSRTLSSNDYRVMYPAIAREMAKIHALDVPVRKIPDSLPVIMKKYLNDVKNQTKQKTESTFEHSDLYSESIEWLTEQMGKSSSPVVFCHNDLLGGNILFRDDSSSENDPRLMLIDFEYGAYNYRGYDFANHFAEWCFNYNSDEYPYFEYNSDNFPSEQEQILFIRAYLNQLMKEGVSLSTNIEDEIKVVLRDIELFTTAAHLFWSVWSWKMSFESNIGFPFVEYARTRLDAFSENKKKYLSQVLPNGESVSHY